MEQEKEIFTQEARVQLNFKSYIAVTFFIAFTWAFIEAIYILAMNYYYIDQTNLSLAALPPTLFFTACVGFFKALLASILAFPVYSYWCNKNKGQVLGGKFGISNKQAI